MKKQPILVVLAAGMGSRYGGLKQIDAVGSHGEAILDYSLYDAYAAGFRTAVIIIKKAIAKDFLSIVGKRLEKCPMEIRYAYQELDKLPEGYSVPEGRVKPWGTSHAVLCAAEAIDGAPFAVINADDYYGKSAYRTVFRALTEAQDGELYDYCMVGYEVGKTVSDHGSVTRGVCKVDGEHCLTSIEECPGIEKYPGGIRRPRKDGWENLPPETTVSMNLWGFTPSFLREAREHFLPFLQTEAVENPLKSEYFLPSLVDRLIRENKCRVTVLHSADQWYGVTYAEDKPGVVAALKGLEEQGLYPDGLWE